MTTNIDRAQLATLAQERGDTRPVHEVDLARLDRLGRQRWSDVKRVDVGHVFVVTGAVSRERRVWLETARPSPSSLTYGCALEPEHAREVARLLLRAADQAENGSPGDE